jgi:hypothetical protein
LAHVPATKYQGPDGLSRCPTDENDSAISEDELELDEPGHFITGPQSLEEYKDWTKDRTIYNSSALKLSATQIKRESYEDIIEFRQNHTVFSMSHKII